MSNEIRSDAIQVLVFEKSCMQNNCKTKKIKSNLEGELKLAILKKAALFEKDDFQKYKDTVEKTLNYLSDEMISESGGFYSAQDADSEGVEGKYYIWDYNEIKNILKGIRSIPAGTEIKVLIPGTNRPQKTKETPYFSNHLLLLAKSLEEIPKYFPFLSKKFESLFSFTNLPK